MSDGETPGPEERREESHRPRDGGEEGGPGKGATGAADAQAGGDPSPEGWDPTRPLPGLRRPDRGEVPGPDASGSSGAGLDAARPGPEEDGEAGATGAGAVEAGDGPADDREEELLLSPHLERLSALASRTAAALEHQARQYARWVVETLEGGGKLLLCGNGGSAATAEHVAAEYVVRFRRRRRPLAAVALTGSGALATAAANDFSFEELFARQIRSLAEPGDLVVLHSTTGDSENLVRAARAAREIGVRSVGVLAGGGGRVAGEVGLALVVPTEDPARAQEVQLALEHAVVDRVDAHFAEGE